MTAVEAPPIADARMEGSIRSDCAPLSDCAEARLGDPPIENSMNAAVQTVIADRIAEAVKSLPLYRASTNLPTITSPPGITSW